MNQTPFLVIGLNGHPVERYATRSYAQAALERLHAETDYAEQDRQDIEFCRRYGVPFWPRRYFVMREEAAFNHTF